MLTRNPGTTFERLRRGFSWEQHLPQKLNIGVACSDAQARDDVALVDVSTEGHIRRFTFGELADLSDRLASALRGIGVRRGDRIAIVLPQGLDAAISHLATYKLGAIAVPMTQLFGPEALAYRLEDSGAKVVITDSGVYEKVKVVVDELGGHVDVVAAADRVDRGHHRLPDLLARRAPAFSPIDCEAPEPALLIYTSGTTGSPKGALHGHQVLIGHLPGFELMFDFFPQAGDILWTPADWAWIGGLLDVVLPSWYHGRPVIAARRSKFDPEWATDLLREHRVTAAFLPPTALKLLRQFKIEPSGFALRTMMSGGEPLGGEMLSWGRDCFGVTINEIYGQTEANLVVGNCASLFQPVPGSMGRPFPGHQVAVLAEGALADPGVVGEIIVRAPDPVMMLRYWGQPAATEEKYVEIDGTAWLQTGDIGHLDEGGNAWFRARADDVIISSGYRIGPAEVEGCILGHPAVVMAAVIGVPDDLRGNIVKAFVVLRDGVAPTQEVRRGIQTHVRDHLAAYEYPREIEFVSELPLTPTGKIRRTDLRK